MKRIIQSLTAIVALSLAGCDKQQQTLDSNANGSVYGIDLAQAIQQSQETEFEKQYSRAVADPAYRSFFVSNLTNHVKFPVNVPTAVYIADIAAGQEQLAMRLDTKTTFLGDRFEKRNSSLEIYPHAFDNVNGYIRDSTDFMFCLKEHEFKHAEVYQNGGDPIIGYSITEDGTLDSKLFSNLSELLAYENEVMLTVDASDTGLRFKGNVSPSYARHALNGSMEHYGQLANPSNFLVSPDVVEALKQKYHLPHFDFARPIKNHK